MFDIKCVSLSLNARNRLLLIMWFCWERKFWYVCKSDHPNLIYVIFPVTGEFCLMTDVR